MCQHYINNFMCIITFQLHKPFFRDESGAQRDQATYKGSPAVSKGQIRISAAVLGHIPKSRITLGST